MKSRWPLAALVFVPAWVLACEENKAPAPVEASLPEAGPTVMTSAPPPQPKPPVVNLDDSAFVVAGDRVELSAGDAKARIAAMMANKPKVAGETLEVDALRDTSMAHLGVALEGLHDAKAKGVTLKTAQRDLTMGSLDVALDHPAGPGCAAVGMVTKDNAINVWPYSGAQAQRFSHGFAGPDITLGSGALRTLANGCPDAPVYFVAGDDSIKWGVVFDLALATKAGGSMKASPLVLTKPPVPGRKVTE